MKSKVLLALFALSLCFSMTSCMVIRQHRKPKPPRKEIPPGHAKKIHGDKSAKYHAPGHR